MHIHTSVKHRRQVFCDCGDVCVCLGQTHWLLSCAFRLTAPQTLHFTQVLASLRCKWFLLQCLERKIADTPGHAFVLPSCLDLPSMTAQTRCKCICYLADLAKMVTSYNCTISLPYSSLLSSTRQPAELHNNNSKIQCNFMVLQCNFCSFCRCSCKIS